MARQLRAGEAILAVAREEELRLHRRAGLRRIVDAWHVVLDVTTTWIGGLVASATPREIPRDHTQAIGASPWHAANLDPTKDARPLVKLVSLPAIENHGADVSRPVGCPARIGEEPVGEFGLPGRRRRRNTNIELGAGGLMTDEVKRGPANKRGIVAARRGRCALVSCNCPLTPPQIDSRHLVR